MKSIRSTNTRLENKVSKELWNKGYRFRRNVKDLFGKPDISIKKYKIAIFIDSCFWHGCPQHGNIPMNNRDYWVRKIKRNRKRDVEVTNYYNSKGWHILRIWEHDLNKKDFNNTISKICTFIDHAKKTN